MEVYITRQVTRKVKAIFARHSLTVSNHYSNRISEGHNMKFSLCGVDLNTSVGAQNAIIEIKKEFANSNVQSIEIKQNKSDYYRYNFLKLKVINQ